MSKQKITVDGDKVINHLTIRLTDRLAQLERENAFLTVENIELKNEINRLKSTEAK